MCRGNFLYVCTTPNCIWVSQCVFVCWVWQLRVWLLKYHGQRLFGTVCNLLIGISKPLPGGAGYVPELLGMYGSAQKILVPKNFTCLLCEKSPHSSHTQCSFMLWCWTSWNGIFLSVFYFTATYRTIFLEPHPCFLGVYCMVVKKYIQGLFCLVIALVFVLCISVFNQN